MSDKTSLPDTSRLHWIIAIGSLGNVVTIVLIIQVWAASNLLSRTEKLRGILTANRVTATQL